MLGPPSTFQLGTKPLQRKNQDASMVGRKAFPNRLLLKMKRDGHVNTLVFILLQDNVNTEDTHATPRSRIYLDPTHFLTVNTSEAT